MTSRPGRIATISAPIIALSLAAIGCSSAATETDNEEQELASITIAEQGTAGTTVGLLAYVAQDQGYFNEQGLEVQEFVAVTSGADAVSGLMTDAVQVFHGADGMIGAANEGAVVGMGALVDRAIWTLVANPEIEEWSDLEGEVLALSSTSDITRVMFDRSSGSSLDTSEVEYTALGGPSQRVAAVSNDQVAATFTSYPSAQTAVENGLNDLGFTPDGEDPSAIVATEIVASEQWVRDEPEQATSYMKAMVQALEYIKDESNGEDVAELVSELNDEPVDSVMVALDTYFWNPPVDNGYFPDDFRHIEGVFDETVDAYQELNLLDASITEDEYMDYTFIDEALNQLRTEGDG